MHYANWIAGSWCPAAAGDSFRWECTPQGEDESISWPRSGLADLAGALAALRAETPAWRATGREQRAAVLGRVLDVWQENGAGSDLIARGLGLEDGDLDEDLEKALEAGDRLLESEPTDDAGDERPVLCRPAGAELHGGLVERVFPPLLAGRGVLLVSDADLPHVVADFVEQLALAAPSGVPLALLHDDRPTTLLAALESREFARASVGGASVELDELRARYERRVSSTATLPARELAPFGVGVIEVPGTRLDFVPTLNCDRIVRSDDDPELAAHEVYEAAFSAVGALSGQRPGSVARVICHERSFSRFSESLLALIDAAEEEGDPLCWVFTRGLRRYAEELFRLGLDEGATLVRGGPGARVGLQRSSANAILAPSVFTNTELTQGVVRASRPAPVISLLRARSDAEAEAMSRELRAESALV